ncbi:MAG: PIN domain-containing protein [Myxococcota bacterium]
MTSVLVDTSVWRRWFGGDAEARPLGELLDEPAKVLVHPWVLAELILGGLSVREQRLLERLPQPPIVAYSEVVELIHRRRLARRGVGWVDANLLASALVTSASLWTLDASLRAAATHLGVVFPVGSPNR